MSGRAAPPKPWERQGGGASTSRVTPLGPSTAGDATRKPWEAGAGAVAGAVPTVSGALVNRSRPWQSGALGGETYGTYGSPTYSGGGGSAPYGSSMYGSSYGSGLGSAYGGSAYGAGYGGGSMFGRPMGGAYGGTYGGGYGSTYGGSAYGGSAYGGTMGAYGGGGMYGQPGGGMYGQPGGGMYGAMTPYGGMGPGAPYGGPEGPLAPPSAWQAMLHTIGGVVHFFGRLSFLVDENAHAVHFFVHALLQLLDRAGSLYGELARFILRLLGYKTPPKALLEPAVVRP
ncbi:hypothetical protein WJX81_004381 [Elliptochloris bilobata]|uniref:Peroxin-13 n=1 Tax=Elliptochloris bilobata TaxID=381761 RepID=A0AAW1RTR7_9CHLO